MELERLLCSLGYSAAARGPPLVKNDSCFTGCQSRVTQKSAVVFRKFIDVAIEDWDNLVPFSHRQGSTRAKIVLNVDND
jgi:hypothetical protein